MEQSLSLIPPIVEESWGQEGGLDPPTVLGDVRGWKAGIENKSESGIQRPPVEEGRERDILRTWRGKGSMEERKQE